MLSTLLACALAGLASVTAIPTISVKGTKFFTSDGEQFFVRGIAYQLVPDDPLVDNKQCELDAKLMKTVGANSIRVYHVEPDADHDACMKTFADAGIYVWLDLDTFNTQIEQDHPRWNQTQVEAFQKVMDAFHEYDNLAGLFVGNEVITKENGTVAAPYIKAAGRDMKAYRDSKAYRNIPIGYSAADIAYNRPMLQNYLACGDNSSEALDFFALNTYSWCGDSSYQQSGYKERVREAQELNIPIFISETGCREPRPRTFEDQAAIFGEMASVYSGAIVYEWIEEANNYGLISYGPKVEPDEEHPDGFTRSGTPTPVTPDFANLSNQWKTLTPSGVKEKDYSPTLTPPACPTYMSNSASQWQVSGNVPLPTIGQIYEAEATKRPGEGAQVTNTQPTNASPTKGAAPESLLKEIKEHATTGRAGCQSAPCKIKIQKGELRLGVEWYNGAADQFWTGWRHWRCVTPAQLQAMKDIWAVDEIPGFKQLNAVSQKHVRDAFREGEVVDKTFEGFPREGEVVESAVAEKTEAKQKAKTIAAYKIDVAVRVAKCRHSMCGEGKKDIVKGMLRFGIVYEETSNWEYYHWQCATQADIRRMKEYHEA
ncbi:uncharacterized protein EI97DRAFT_456323 [Westerdykella ornata]|uniref:1,3-beta-glucanosyltransferase n=1 Tax=Westerdykella ornata TaxID=318751 RepID=A0A6A6JQH1_WESOR|nr:uncharacterized protein EI97DRAFT_456323 [Westerdykella ornata]KAF2278890.1 hypothetical protein EI97DRAFT_456323 [Westerdykella ornata]